MHKADISSKRVINIYNQAWASWILQDEQIEVEAELSGEFQFVARDTDSLLKIKGKSGQFLALTELQLVYKPDMPQRLATYKLLAEQKYSLNMFVTVVYFLQPGPDVMLAERYEQVFKGQRAYVEFQVIKLWEMEAKAVLAFDNPALLPFVPLMQGGDSGGCAAVCGAYP